MNLVSLLFSFQGRITRAQYWLGNLAVVVGVFIVSIAGVLIAAPTTDTSAAAGLMLTMFSLVMLAGSWCGLALQVKRFHDRGKSGLFALAPLIPATMMFMAIAGGAATGASAPAVAANVLPWMGIGMLINLWLLIELGCLPGKDGPNKYDGTSTPPAQPKSGGSSVASMLGSAQSAMDRAVEGRAAPTAST
ncbi:MAG TPA: DUF805 domain-containing protein, partial [Verrucomicrobiae bacterium]|nr:DUF805 domain-containing protein [Verrucomicrobiae bacterium]